MNDRKKCEKCNKEFKSNRSLFYHIKKEHGLSVNNYYDEFYKKEKEGVCYCGNRTNFANFNDGYLKYCSNSCAQKSKDTRDKINKTLNSKYGENYNLSAHLKKGMVDKYGVENSMFVKEIKEKVSNKLKKNKEENNEIYNNWLGSLRSKWNNKTYDEKKEISEKRLKTNPEMRFCFVNYAKKMGYENVSQKFKFTFDEFVDRASTLQEGRFSYKKIDKEDFTMSNDNVLVICKKCGFSYEQAARYHAENKNFYCKKCNKNISKGEIKIKDFLEKNNITFKPQKTFDNCKNPKTGRKLRFDFYIERYNLCIEYDGEVHSNKTRYNNLNEVLYRDWLKDNYCEENNINLLRINYKSLNDIENILTNYTRLKKMEAEGEKAKNEIKNK